MIGSVEDKLLVGPWGRWHGRNAYWIIAQMARNTGDSYRQGAVKDRVQILNPVTQRYVKVDTRNGRILEEKRTEGPYKGITDITKRK